MGIDENNLYFPEFKAIAYLKDGKIHKIPKEDQYFITPEVGKGNNIMANYDPDSILISKLYGL